MILADYTTLQTPLRTIKGKVELLGSSTTTFSHTDALKSFKIERLGESGKFFGFGISQKLTVNLLDKDRVINIEDGAKLKPYLTAEDEYRNDIFTTFAVKGAETKRDENTNELTIVAYDMLAAAANHTFSELEIAPPYNLFRLANAITELLTDGEYPVAHYNNQAFELTFEDGANYDGTETLREVLDDIAEATQTIYYLDKYTESLAFKCLSAETALTIDKTMYFELDSGEPVTLAAICSATELGDNITATGTATGVTQYVRDNGLWDLREDRAMLLEAAINGINGLTIQPFNCSWRGNYYLEIADKIEIEAKDGSYVSSYVLNDVIEYNGALKQKTQWQYTKQEETATNPSTLGEVLKQTYAKVDKANKKIDLVAYESSANNSAIAQLNIDIGKINGSVESVQKQVEVGLDSANESIVELTNKVNATMTAEELKIEVQQQIANGVNKVETSTGFTFDETGLTVDKTNSEMKTTITEDGMTVYKNDEAVLVADNVGVNAKNLHATTYLIIGTNSRFEDYGTNRTGCFWIGGNS